MTTELNPTDYSFVVKRRGSPSRPGDAKFIVPVNRTRWDAFCFMKAWRRQPDGKKTALTDFLTERAA